MNKYQKELLEMCKDVDMWDKIPLLEGIYILPTTRKHDSGYKIMKVAGYSKGEYYLLDEICDVIDFGNLYCDEKRIKDLHIDILDNGVIHLWSRYQYFKIIHMLSSCTFDIVDKE